MNYVIMRNLTEGHGILRTVKCRLRLVSAETDQKETILCPSMGWAKR